MKSILKLAAVAVVGLSMVGVAKAGDVLVTSNIAVSETWTRDNIYRLENQIYVLPGATLTIESGTLVESNSGVGGSLAVSRGAQIIAKGTARRPIVFTSTDDDRMNWQELANTWGNITLMGSGFISEDAVAGNMPTCDAGNEGVMEGLVEDFPMDPKVRYGGGDDDDDSGCLEYVSLRYGGRVIGLNNELNGLSLGGIGRGTDINHIEIMNNVDDGIEIWGGTVNIKYFSIWNIGDDSFDVDQGWRGKAQFGLIVQGHSLDASQGSGVGDNCFETDGAEQSDYQPVTTATIYNCTVIGQPLDGDGGTAWRDNARVQYRNCIFMDLGERLVRFDDIDGDGGLGYGHNGTLSWADTWTTPFDMVPPHANDCPPGTYQAQVDGNLAEITDSIFARNLASDAYTESDARGVTPGNGTNNNVVITSILDADQPIKGITRGPAVSKGGKMILPVLTLDPRPANEALTSVNVAPNDGFFTPGRFRGAFDPGQPCWLDGWSAADEFGFLPNTLFCFDMLRNGNPIAKLVIKKNNPRTATIVQNGVVLCDEAPLTIVNPSPQTAEFSCGGPTVTIVKDGPNITWSAGPFNGTLELK